MEKHLFTNVDAPIRNRDEAMDLKENLRRDFHGRCAYCNALENTIPGLEYNVEHLIPKKKAKDNGHPELEFDYNNMVFACKKCNLHKSQTWPFDDYDLNHTYDKSLGKGFYDPCKVNFNQIFYRNEYGLIMSDDPVGKYMINHLKLYILFRNVEWYCEKFRDLMDALQQKRKKYKDKNYEICLAIADISEKFQNYMDYISACLNG